MLMGGSEESNLNGELAERKQSQERVIDLARVQLREAITVIPIALAIVVVSDILSKFLHLSDSNYVFIPLLIISYQFFPNDGLNIGYAPFPSTLTKAFQSGNKRIVLKLIRFYRRMQREKRHIVLKALSQELESLTVNDSSLFSTKELRKIASLLKSRDAGILYPALHALAKIGDESVTDDIGVFIDSRSTNDSLKLEAQTSLNEIRYRLNAEQEIVDIPPAFSRNLTPKGILNIDPEEQEAAFESIERSARISKRSRYTRYISLLVVLSLIHTLGYLIGLPLWICVVIDLLYFYTRFNPKTIRKMNELIKNRENRVVFRYLPLTSMEIRYSSNSQFTNIAKRLLPNVKPEDAASITHYQMRQLLSLLKSDDEELQLAVVLALDKIGKPEHINDLQKILLQHKACAELMTATREAIKMIEQRSHITNDNKSLLRATAIYNDNDLLKPEGSAHADSRDLLHPSEEE